MTTPEGWVRVEHSEDFYARWAQHMGDQPIPEVFETEDGVLRALVGYEPVGVDDRRWHISVSGLGRVPTWEELVDTAHALRPGVPFVVGIPPRSWWINVHPDVLHLWESEDINLVAAWKHEALGMTPT